MAITDWSPQELAALQQQGIDPRYATPAPSVGGNDPTMTQGGAVTSTLKGNAGGILGGGAGALAGSRYGGMLGRALMAGGKGLATGEVLGGGPEDPLADVAGAGLGAAGLIGSVLGGVGGAAAGGYGGQRLQQSFLSPEENTLLAQQALQAQQQYPKTALGTDIAASALASGGGFSPTTAVRGVRDLIPAVMGRGISGDAANVLLQSAVNPAINTGLQYATTGTLPSRGDLAAQALGGALFAKPNALGRMVGGHQVQTQQADNDEVQPQQPQPEQPPTTPSPYTEQDEDGNYLIDNKGVTDAFQKLNPKPAVKNLPVENAAQAMTQYRQTMQMPVDDKRTWLHDQWMKQQGDLAEMNENRGSYRDLMGQVEQANQAIALPSQETAEEAQPPQPPLPPNMGGSEQDLTPEQQAVSQQNNSREAFESLARQQGTTLPTAVDPNAPKPVSPNTLRITAPNFLQSNIGRPEVRPSTAVEGELESRAEANPVPVATYADRAEELAAKLEKIKSGFNPNQLHAFGVLPATWDAAVSIAQGVIRAGGHVADAIEAAVAHIKKNVTSGWDERGVREHLASVLQEKPTAKEESVKPTTSSELSPNLTFKPTRSALDTIRELPTTAGRKLADALHSTFIERKHYIGDLWNPIAKQMQGMSKADIQQVHNTLQTEDRAGRFQTQMLRTPNQRRLYRLIRDFLNKDADLRIKERLPVYQNGQPRLAKKNPTYYPDIVNSKVRQILQANTDTTAVKQLRDDFVKNRMKLGQSREEAEVGYLDQLDKMQGSQDKGVHSGGTHFAASRQPEGLPLPTSWTENDARKSLATYFNRKATDYSFFKHVEKNPEAMAALGNKKDAWGNPIEQANPSSKNHVTNINQNTAVKNVIHELSIEAGDQVERTQHRIESLATASILGPLTELHKVVSTFFKALTYYDNPAAMAHMSVKAAMGFSKGYERAMSNGQGQLSSRGLADFVDNHLTWADRFAGAAQGIRDIYTAGQLTERFMVGSSQIHAEYLVRGKLAQANSGDAAATRLMRFLDPTYQAGKTYDAKGMSQLATEMAGMWHGSRDARTLPAWMLHDNEISAFMKLSSWGIAQTNNFMRDVWTPAVRDKQYQPLVTAMFGGLLGGYVIKELRERLSGKQTGIPSLTEIGASSRGFEGNIPALAYNAMAAASYAGLGGIISQVARYPFDVAFRNTPQSATFPLDAVTTNLAKTATNVVDAMLNSVNPNYLDIATKAGLEVIGQNLQLARVGINQGINLGLITGLPAEQKELSDKLGELRRFKEVEGLPVDAQTDSAKNPLLNLDQKEFKHTQDLGQAVRELPALVSEIVGKYGNEPDLMLEKLKELKSNPYSTFPDMETLPLEYVKYISYLNRVEGPQQAQQELTNYLRKKMVNEVKSGLVP